jgi:hypothetical protein
MRMIVVSENCQNYKSGAESNPLKDVGTGASEFVEGV